MKLYKAKLCHGRERVIIAELNSLDNVFMHILPYKYAEHMVLRVIKQLCEVGMDLSLVHTIYTTYKKYWDYDGDGAGEIYYGDESVAFYNLEEL